MKKIHQKITQGYHAFREKYHQQDSSIMEMLADKGQSPDIMVVSCCDSRVDPALLMQCDPGDLFVVRNVANIVPPCENDEYHHGTSAALEFGICYLNIKHLIILGHSDCGGLHAYLNQDEMEQDDFITHWVSQLNLETPAKKNLDLCAQDSLDASFKNCLTFPWLKKRLDDETLSIHRWFFNIKTAEIFAHSPENGRYEKLDKIIL